MNMLLNTAAFDAVLEQLGAEAGEAGGGQRLAPRATLDARLTIIPCPAGELGPQGPPLAVPVRDLSRGGVRFLLPRRVPLGTSFILLLPQPRATEIGDGPSPFTPASPLAVLCAVAWWQPLARDLFALGGEFIRELTGFQSPGIVPRVVLPGMVGDEERAAGLVPVLLRAAS